MSYARLLPRKRFESMAQPTNVVRMARLAIVVLASANWPGAFAAARAQSDGVPWTVSMNHVNRSCTVMLGFDEAGAAGSMNMPAGCRRALPVLRDVRSWTVAADGTITFNGDLGRAILVFDRQPDGAWRTSGTEMAQQLTLTPAAPTPEIADLPGGDSAMALASDGPVTRVASALPSKGKSAGAGATEIAGRYAVMRGDRDTGCMVTLDAGTSGPKGLRARLAPACRDQSIIIFDPLGWQEKNGKLVLIARKGHSITLEKDANGVWMKTPSDAKALGLKPL